MAPRTLFAAIEQQVNADVLGALANASISVAGGTPFAGIFDNDYVLAEVGSSGMAATAPAITVPTAAVPAPFTGAAVEVTYLGAVTRWRAAEHHPDGTGMSLLLLERAK